MLDNRQLSQGYAVSSASLTVLGTACNDVLSAETVAMVKEHIIEELGRAPVWTVGEGGSGGSIQQQMIAQNYPGLLDGLMPGASFPDSSQPNYPDCRLLNAYFATADGQTLTDEQKIAIHGMADPNSCAALGAGADVVNATEGCDESVVGPLDLQPGHQPRRRPLHALGQHGQHLRPRPGDRLRAPHARQRRRPVRPRRAAAGAITSKQFLDLNEAIGGYDNNGNLVAQRSVADPEALAIAYRTGRINQTAGGFTDVPMVDVRDYVDDEVNVHQYLNTYIIRARLDRRARHLGQPGDVPRQGQRQHDRDARTRRSTRSAAGSMRSRPTPPTARSPRRSSPTSPPTPSTPAGSAASASTSRPRSAAPAIARPPTRRTASPCSRPASRSTRSSPSASCARPNSADYPALTADQQARLAAIFPNGVCDWSQAGRRPAAARRHLAAVRAVAFDQGAKARPEAQRRRAAQGRATVRMTPCPESNWQRVSVERKRSAKKWKPLASGIVTGKRCEFTARLRLSEPTSIRAHAKPIDGFTGAHSKQVRIRVR